MALGSLALFVAASSVFANPLISLTVDEKCDSSTHVVTIVTLDVNSPHFITIVGQVLNGSTWTDSGAQKTVTVSTDAPSC